MADDTPVAQGSLNTSCHAASPRQRVRGGTIQPIDIGIATGAATE